MNSLLEKLGGKSSETQSLISPAAKDVNSKPDSQKSLEPSISVRMRCFPNGVYSKSKLSPSEVKAVIHPARLKRSNKLRKSSELGIGSVMLPNLLVGRFFETYLDSRICPCFEISQSLPVAYTAKGWRIERGKGRKAQAAW